MLRENWTAFSITVDKYFLPLQSNFCVRLEVVSHYISQNLEAVDHLVSEIKNYNECHMAFSHKYTWILLDHLKSLEPDDQIASLK